VRAANSAVQTPPSHPAAVIASGDEDGAAARLETLHAAEAWGTATRRGTLSGKPE
jgi:hypothetical protein